MKEDVVVKNGIIIPAHELEITATRAGGPGGQHVNKTSTRISVRWNIHNTSVLSEQQKEQVLQKLQSDVTKEGDIIVSYGASRSQAQNKKEALSLLAQKIKQALKVPKKRMKTRLPKKAKEGRLQKKKKRGEVKKMRSKKIEY